MRIMLHGKGLFFGHGARNGSSLDDFGAMKFGSNAGDLTEHVWKLKRLENVKENNRIKGKSR